MDLHVLLEKAANDHHHLCPRQVLGVRIGLAGMNALGFVEPPTNKRLLLISETDGCFVDGLWAATNCSVGHRTLRVEDYGKTAAVFVDVISGRAVRVARRPAFAIKRTLMPLMNHDITLLSFRRIKSCPKLNWSPSNRWC